MAQIPKRVANRIQSGLKRYAKVIQTQYSRDVSEADTVTVVKDLLNDVFGFDKYAEITGEYAIRGTYCDLAIKLDGKLRVLIEVKAIGIELKDSHVRQAMQYATNQGIDWVILTNGRRWVLYHVIFKKPIDKEEVVDVDMISINPKQEADLEKLFLFTKEGILKDALAEYRDRKDATNRFMLAAILIESDSVINAIRREVRRTSDILVESEVIQRVLRDEVIKRDLLESEQAVTAIRRYNRIEKAAKPKRKPRTKQSSKVDSKPAIVTKSTEPVAAAASGGSE